MASPALLGASLLACSIAFWGGSFWATEVGAGHTEPSMLALLRTVPAFIVLAGLITLGWGRWPAGKALWTWAATSGVLMVTVFYVGFSEGVPRAGAGNGAVLANSTPLWVLVITWIVLRERVTLGGAAGLLLGFAGVVVMVAPQIGGSDDTGQLVLGCLLCLAAAIGWGVGTLMLSRMLRERPDVDMLGFTAAQFVVGVPIIAAIALGLNGVSGTDWGSSSLWGSVAYLSLGASAAASVAFFVALRYTNATTASAWLFLTPVVGVIVELARGNTPDAIVGVGMALTIVGVAVVNLAPRFSARRSLEAADTA